MPDPNKKISSPTSSPYEIKLVCSEQAEENKKSSPIKPEAGKECKSAVIEKQATLLKEPCPTGTGCHLARPERSADPTSRIDNKKPGCINFESCEEEEETAESKLESGCLDYEDCKDYLKEEKRRIKAMKEEEKQRRKEQLKKAKEEHSNKCGN